MRDLRNTGLKQTSPNLPPIYKIFESIVRKTPEAIAAICKDQELTYRELDLESNRLAHFLIYKGVQPGKVIGLCVDCDLKLLIGILAILKAGGVYFPLDPAYPTERFRYMLKDADPFLVLTISEYEDRFDGYLKPILLLDGEHERIQSCQESSLGIEVSPIDLAYLIYTSGSTGKPKGIMIPHQAVSIGAIARRSLYPSQIRGLVTGSISFDVSLITIFHTLADGGTVCLPGTMAVLDIEATIRLINEKEINFMMCVPSFYALLLEKKREMPSLKAVSLGGESLPRPIPHLHAQYAFNANLFNEYGPSEWAMGTTIAKIVDAETKTINPITVGKPHPGATIYLLNEHFLPVSEEEKGEVFIEGDGLAIGYLNRPELTAERFLTLSIEGKNRRVYRTGDFARKLPNGDLEYLGRIDNQVKIRGFRIELGEVEQVISQYPSIQEAAVLTKEDEKGNIRIIAYFTAETMIDKTRIKEFLLQHLPSAAVPSSIIQIAQFKRTPNGKIDRSSLLALPLPDFLIEPMDEVAPQSKLELKLAAIWKSVLDKKEVGIHDNFFDMGGDSLSIANLQTAMDRELNLHVSIVDLFQYPTIAQMSRHLDMQTTSNLYSTSSSSINKKQAFLKFKMKAGK
jgi:amino acid adenylation domain-containing protein